MAETKKQKRLKLASWLLLTVVPAIFTVLVLIFNFGGNAQGYVDKLEHVEARVSDLDPRMDNIEKLAADRGALLIKIESYFDENHKMLTDLQTIGIAQSISIAEIKKEIDIRNVNIAKFWATDWKDLQSRLDRIEQRIDNLSNDEK